MISPVVDVSSPFDNLDDANVDEELNYPLPYPSLPHGDAADQHVIPLNNRLLHLLLKSNLLQRGEYRPRESAVNYNKRYAAQAFHAMRG